MDNLILTGFYSGFPTLWVCIISGSCPKSHPSTPSQMHAIGTQHSIQPCQVTNYCSRTLLDLFLLLLLLLSPSHPHYHSYSGPRPTSHAPGRHMSIYPEIQLLYVDAYHRRPAVNYCLPLCMLDSPSPLLHTAKTPLTYVRRELTSKLRASALYPLYPDRL